MFCPKCGANLPKDTKVCPECKTLQANAKFCEHCGEAIDKECVVCPKCGKQVGQANQQQPQVVINNSNTANANSVAIGGFGIRPKNKWVALLLCFFLGFLGAHKFYEGKILLGIVYIFTVGLLGIGLIIDFISLLFKPNPYFV